MMRRSAKVHLGSTAQPEDNEKPKAGRAKRFGFTIIKDIALLKSTLQHNPFQLGSTKWNDVASEIQATFQGALTERTVKDRVFHLKDQYEKQQLCFKTGTEEEKSERGRLLENIIELFEESVTPINEELGASVEIDFVAVETPSSSTRKEIRDERTQADKERAKLSNDLATEPSHKRKKARILPEDELIKLKLQHDMKLEEERLRFEEEKSRKEQEMEEKRLELESKKFDFEREREQRLLEEGKRRDELAKIQLGFQEQLLKIMSKLTDK